jgi:hypothetical protein
MLGLMAAAGQEYIAGYNQQVACEILTGLIASLDRFRGPQNNIKFRLFQYKR